MTAKSYRILFLLIVLCTLAFRIWILHLHSWPINGDEAQYWNWSQYLAWGDYSKPPMVAGVIAVTVKLFGNGAIGLRIGSPIAYCITAIFLYLSGTRLFSERVGFWTGLLFLLIPGVSFSSSIISTDPLLLMFWSIAFYGLIRALEENTQLKNTPKKHTWGWWFFSACMLGLAFYCKYAAILFTISFILLMLTKPYRCMWKTSGPYLLIIVPFIILIPNLYWNINHHFASVTAVAANADLTSNLFHPMNFLNFVGSQFGMFEPILFTILLLILFQSKKFIHDKRYLLLYIFTFVTLGIMTIESLLSHAHANWSAPAFIAATIAVCAVTIERKQLIWLWLSLLLSILAMLGLANIQYLVRTYHVPMDQEMTIISWPNAAKQINHIRQHYPNSFLLVDDRMLLTQILYFAKVPMFQTVRWNPSHKISDQYDIMTSMDGKNGKNFILASYIKHPVSIVQHFTKSRLIKTISLQTIDGKPMTLYIFRLKNFHGY